ncbi:MAG: trans-sulfuration enzyme family protein [Candidatus Aminicenantales bacterium]
MKNPKARSPFTDVIHAGKKPEPGYKGLSVPIYQSSTFAFESAEQGADFFAGRQEGYIYTRLGNPTIRALEDALASLEHGYRGLGTATGMAAISTVYAALLGRDSHMIGTASMYAASRTIIETEFARFGVKYDFVDTRDIGNIERALRPETKLLMIETPANPTMHLTDIRAAADLARKHNLTLVVDNTFCSPILQTPLDLGADIVVHSLTKFISGHGDVIGGMIVTREEALFTRLRQVLKVFGGTMDPHQAWLVLRGSKTLALRMERAQENASKLAPWLESHPLVSWVNYPGLASHPQRALAQAQMKGFGSMLAFGLKGGFEAGRKMMNAVKLCTLAVSLGSVESLIQHPASMTHSIVPKAEREEAGIMDDMIRLSVGCEGYEDLRDDLDQALARSAE